MRRINKLAAFTLFELLMVMILISIVVTILGSALFNVSGFHKRLKDRVDQVGSFKEFKYVINRDFNRMKFYSVEQSELTFSDGIDTVIYSFGDYIIRQQGVRTDSIPIVSGISFNDSTTSIVVKLGERKTSIRLSPASSGVLSYQASDSGSKEDKKQ